MMQVVMIIAGALLAVALVVRERQLASERDGLVKTIERLHRAQKQLALGLRKSREDLFLLRAALREKRMLSDQELVETYSRLVSEKEQRMRQEAQTQAKRNAGHEIFRAEGLSTKLKEPDASLLPEQDEIIH